MDVLIRHADKINALDHQRAEMMKKYKPFREKLGVEFTNLVSVGLNIPKQLRANNARQDQKQMPPPESQSRLQI